MLKKPRFGWCKAIGTCLLVFALSGCRAEQTQAGRAPDVDIAVDLGRWPKYDVDWADVTVGTEQRTIEVPVVRIVEETRKITVPYIDIEPAEGVRREERTISMELDVPHSGYQLAITEVGAAAAPKAINPPSKRFPECRITWW